MALATSAPVEDEPLTDLLPDDDPEPVHAAGPRFVWAADALCAKAPMQTADSANTTSSLRYATANTPKRA